MLDSIRLRFLLLAPVFVFCTFYIQGLPTRRDVTVALARCEYLSQQAGPSPSYRASHRVRHGSDRYAAGTKPTLIQNAKIWTAANNGTQTISGDILFDKGLIVALGHIPDETLRKLKGAYETFDARGKWVTRGIVDIHSHIGLSSAPYLSGAADTNSRKGPILPWIRSIDALNTHDASYELAIAGGVTTAQILPGSAGNIGGQSFLIKLGTTKDRSVMSKILEPPQTLIQNQTSSHIHWRHMNASGTPVVKILRHSILKRAWTLPGTSARRTNLHERSLRC